jgi:hypothetical protein
MCSIDAKHHKAVQYDLSDSVTLFNIPRKTKTMQSAMAGSRTEHEISYGSRRIVYADGGRQSAISE